MLATDRAHRPALRVGRAVVGTGLVGERLEACRYHAYELAPTAAELSRWIDAVDELIRINPA
jgi:hypothetical protein